MPDSPPARELRMHALDPGQAGRIETYQRGTLRR
jgi:hypothetical protein